MTQLPEAVSVHNPSRTGHARTLGLDEPGNSWEGFGVAWVSGTPIPRSVAFSFVRRGTGVAEYRRPLPPPAAEDQPRKSRAHLLGLDPAYEAEPVAAGQALPYETDIGFVFPRSLLEVGGNWVGFAEIGFVFPLPERTGSPLSLPMREQNGQTGEALVSFPPDPTPSPDRGHSA